MRTLGNRLYLVLVMLLLRLPVPVRTPSRRMRRKGNKPIPELRILLFLH